MRRLHTKCVVGVYMMGLPGENDDDGHGSGFF